MDEVPGPVRRYLQKVIEAEARPPGQVPEGPKPSWRGTIDEVQHDPKA